MLKQDIIQLIVLNKTFQALTELARISRETDIQNYVLQQLARFNQNENANNWGTITRNEYEVEHNRITKSLLEFVEGLSDTPSVFTPLDKSLEKNKSMMTDNSTIQNAGIKPKALTIFLSYSHKDEELKEQLDAHLASLKRNNLIKTWNDRAIVVGDEWDSVIKKQLEESDIILLLVSANFIASDYIWKVEITEAMKRHDNKEVVVVPIFIKPCDWKDMPFSKLQGLPRDAVPVTKHNDRDEALMRVAKGIRVVVERLASV